MRQILTSRSPPHLVANFIILEILKFILEMLLFLKRMDTQRIHENKH